MGGVVDVLPNDFPRLGCPRDFDFLALALKILFIELPIKMYGLFNNNPFLELGFKHDNSLRSLEHIILGQLLIPLQLVLDHFLYFVQF